MEIKVDKPNTPVLWLDSWVIIELTRKTKQKVVDKESQALFENLLKLRNGLKILCPESEQLTEVEAGYRLVKEAKELLSQISGGVSFGPPELAEEQQIQKGIKAYLAKTSELTLDWSACFLENPIEELKRNKPFIIRVDFPTTEKDIKERKKFYKELAEELERERIAALEMKQTFETRLLIEKQGILQAINALLAKYLEKTMKGENTFDESIKLLPLIGSPLSYWKHFGGRDTDLGGLKGLFDFYKSEYFTNLPYFHITANLHAVKETGQEVIKPSDALDIKQISAYLPFCHYMVIDKSMTDKLRKLKLDTKYKTNLIKFGDLNTLTDNLLKGK